MKVSVTCTLKDEEKSIKELIGSILSQSKLPDKIVIVDGGSTDRTVEIINSYIKSGAPINLIIKEGVNIAEGRNIAIENAKYDNIASIDAGSWADKDWLKNLLRPFEEFEEDSSVDVVAGFFLPDAKSKYEEVVGELLYPKLENMNPDRFLPSGRSIAFKKRCWETVGGYPEWLYTGEDALFDLKLRESGCKFAFARDAIVYWRPRTTLRGLFKQYFLYAKGATQARITNTITLEPYGENIVKYLVPLVLKYCSSLFRKREIVRLFYVFIILSSVFIAKLTGIAAGKITKSHKMERGTRRI
jgi:glycosyltransferase involved in cell wall biosynthesis